MKIALGLVAVLVLLLGMIAAIGHLDGSITFGEPSEAANSPADDSAPTGIEVAYLEFVVGTLQTVSNDMNTLGFLFSQPAFDDEYWKSSATVVLNRIELAHGSIATLEPTPRLQPFQDASEDALAHCSEFAGIIRDLLVQRRTELSDEAAVELMAAADSFGLAEELLNEFLDAHPLPQ